ncbi:hypothetical protein GEMRC1_007192 [Eukaryota sp. GEM-RC1]
MDQTTLNDWKMLDLIGTNNTCQVLERNIWRLLINKSQYSSTTAAKDAITEIRLGSSKDPAECFDRYRCGVISVLKCSMAIIATSSDETVRTMVPASTVAEFVLETLNPDKGIIALNELVLRWDHRLKTEDDMLPQFFQEVKSIWTTYSVPQL